MSQYCTRSRRQLPARIIGLVVMAIATQSSQAFLSRSGVGTVSSSGIFMGWQGGMRPTRWKVSQMIEEDEDSNFLSEEVPEPSREMDVQEKTWRYASKPLLRIGAKGATGSHGNSLRQLLEDHTIVKVKVNTRRFDNSVEVASQTLLNLAVESGAPSDIEIIQFREGSKEILFGLPGTLQQMEAGTYPPPKASKEPTASE